MLDIIYISIFLQQLEEHNKVYHFLDHIWYTPLRIFYGRSAACPKFEYNYFTTFLKQCNEMSHMLTLEDGIVLYK